MRRIVCDTGPLLHLHEADLLPLLRLAGDILVPPAVEAERAIHLVGWALPGWARIVALHATALERALMWQRAGQLDPGEAQALALARQEDAGWLLTDDAAARWIAQSLGQEVHGSLGVVLPGPRRSSRRAATDLHTTTAAAGKVTVPTWRLFRDAVRSAALPALIFARRRQRGANLAWVEVLAKARV